jgi:hypothetical protein
MHIASIDVHDGAHAVMLSQRVPAGPTSRRSSLIDAQTQRANSPRRTATEVGHHQEAMSS